MKRFLRWTAGIVAGLLVLVLTGAIFMGQILKGFAERRIRAQTGMETRIGRLTLNFSPAGLHIQDLKIMNPPEFGRSVLADIPEVFLELDNGQARAGKLHFKQIRFRLNEFNVVKGKNGRLNVQRLEQLASTNSAAAGPQQNGKTYQFGGIDKMYLSLGKLRYTDLVKTNRNEEIDLGVENELVEHIQTEADLKTWYGAFCVRIFLQVVTQQMMNGPDRAQSFAETMKELSRSVP